MLCIDDPERAETYSRLISEVAPRYGGLSDREQILARMLFLALWPNGGRHALYDAGLPFLRSYPLVCAEIRQLAAPGVQRSGYAPRAGSGIRVAAGSDVLACYLSAGRSPCCAGVLRAGREDQPSGRRREETKNDAFFGTLEKDEKERDGSIMYNYPESAIGRRCHKSRVTSSDLHPPPSV